MCGVMREDHMWASQRSGAEDKRLAAAASRHFTVHCVRWDHEADSPRLSLRALYRYTGANVHTDTRYKQSRVMLWLCSVTGKTNISKPL